jgi:hypothetical protein
VVVTANRVDGSRTPWPSFSQGRPAPPATPCGRTHKRTTCGWAGGCPARDVVPSVDTATRRVRLKGRDGRRRPSSLNPRCRRHCATTLPAFELRPSIHPPESSGPSSATDVRVRLDAPRAICAYRTEPGFRLVGRWA